MKRHVPCLVRSTARWLAPCFVAALVAGCGGGPVRPDDTPVTLIPDQGGWFCEADASGTGWRCVQDPALGVDPRRERGPATTVQPRLETPAEADGSSS